MGNDGRRICKCIKVATIRLSSLPKSIHYVWPWPPIFSTCFEPNQSKRCTQKRTKQYIHNQYSDCFNLWLVGFSSWLAGVFNRSWSDDVCCCSTRNLVVLYSAYV